MSDPSGNGIADYIAKRLEPQIAWYDAKATRAKQRVYLFGIMQIIASSLIPVVNGAVRYDLRWLFVTSVLAAFAAIAGSIIVFSKLREEWVNYRRIHTSLTALQVRHAHAIPPFNTTKRDKIFMERCEAIMEEESAEWVEEKS